MLNLFKRFSSDVCVESSTDTLRLFNINDILRVAENLTAFSADTNWPFCSTLSLGRPFGGLFECNFHKKTTDRTSLSIL